MDERSLRLSRRKFLASTAAFGLAAGSPAEEPPPLSRTRPARPARDGRKPLALLTTVYRPLSHAYHIGGRFLHGYALGGKFHVPGQYVHSLFVDQIPANDLSRGLCREFDIRPARTVEEALTEGGKLAVEGVLLVGEHGNYPRNDRGQTLYPRYEWMEEVAAVFRKVGRAVPVFNDKHLSYTASRARKMVGWARELGFPLMAGSSLPVVWRRPELELPLESPVEDALVACYGGLEIYGFHALETLQVMVERRKGGETGVKAVTCLTGKEVWRAGDTGKWSWPLLEAALARSETVNPGDVRVNTGSMPVLAMPATPATAFLIEYADGTRGTVLLLNGHIQDFVFAARLKGEVRPASCLFLVPPPPGARFFDAQVSHLERFFETGKSALPVERTVLTTGVLDAALASHQRGGVRVETPELDVRYAAPADSGFLRGSLADL